MELELIKEFGIVGVVIAGAYFMLRYFMERMDRKDAMLIQITKDSLSAISNNTEAINDLRDSIDSREEYMQRQHEKMSNIMQVATSSISNNTKQLQVIFNKLKDEKV